MSKAKLEFDLTDLDDRMEFERSNKSTDIDIASATGNLEKLNNWLSASLKDNTFNLLFNNDYTSDAIDNASINNKKIILDWWLENSKKYNLPLKYTEKSINGASKAGYIDILNWWYNSNLELKYFIKYESLIISLLSSVILPISFKIISSKLSNSVSFCF